MPNDQTLSIVIKLKDEASAGLTALSERMNTMGTQVGTAVAGIGNKLSTAGAAMTDFGKSMSAAGRSMTTSLTLPIAGLGYEVVNTSMKFQSSMELIRTQAGATQQEVDDLSKSVLNLAKSGDTGQGPQALADGLYHLESLGLRGAQAMDALKISAQAADTGLADMEGVTNALGAAVVTGIKGTQNYSEAMGTLDATIGAGNMRMNDLVAALGTGVLPAAKNFGLSLTDVGAALATLTDNGMRADESATRLRMTFSLMAAPTKKATKALASIGLSQFQLADDMRSKGLVPAIQDLNKHLTESGLNATQQAAVLSEAFGGGRTSAAILTLTQQVDRLSSKYTQINEQTGLFEDKVQATHQTNQYKLNAAMAQMQATLIDLGGTVMPIFVQVLQQATEWLEKFAGWWDTLSPSTQEWIVKGMALLAILGPLLTIGGGLVTALGSIAKIIGPVVTGMGELGAALAGDATSMSAFMVAAAPWLITLAAIAAAVYLIADAFGKMQDSAGAAMSAGNQALGIANSKQFNDLVAKSSGAQKEKLMKIQQSTTASANAAIATGQRYSGTGGFFNAIGDFFTGGPSAPAAPAATPQYNFNFNGTVAGDQGIKDIITQTVSTINRQSQLRTYAGTRS